MNDLLRDVKAAYEGMQTLDIKPTRNNLMILNFTLNTLQKAAEVFHGILANEKTETGTETEGGKADGGV